MECEESVLAWKIIKTRRGVKCLTSIWVITEEEGRG